MAPTVLPALAIMTIPLFRNYRLFLLSTWPTSSRRGFLDKLIWKTFIALWMRLYYIEEDPEVREAQKSLAMGGSSGRAWAEGYNATPWEVLLQSRIGNLPFLEARPIYDTVDNILSGIPEEQSSCLILVGSSSGRDVDWFASRHPVTRCVGIDIYPEVVEYAAAHYSRPNLEFILLSARDIGKLVDPSTNCKYIVMSASSLKYVQPEHVLMFFKDLASTPNVEVLACGIYIPKMEADSIPAGNFTYIHDYRRYGEREGFITLKEWIVRTGDDYRPRPPIYNWRGLSGATTGSAHLIQGSPVKSDARQSTK